MKKQLRISLLVITLGLISLSFSRGVRGSEFSDASKDILTADSEWRLVVDGEVHSALNLTLDELQMMERSTVFAELYCYGEFVTSGNWIGVRLGLLLEEAGLYPEVVNVTFYANDSYTTTLSIAKAMREDVIVAYEKDGEPLPERTRLVIPGENGAQWISMITEITVGTVRSIPEFPAFPAMLLVLGGVTIIVLQKRLKSFSRAPAKFHLLLPSRI